MWLTKAETCLCPRRGKTIYACILLCLQFHTSTRDSRKFYTYKEAGLWNRGSHLLRELLTVELKESTAGFDIGYCDGCFLQRNLHSQAVIKRQVTMVQCQRRA